MVQPTHFQNPLVDLANFQERVQRDTIGYEQQGIQAMGQVGAQLLGGTPEQKAAMLRVGSERIKNEMLQMEFAAYNQELDTRMKRAATQLAERQTMAQIKKIQLEEATKDQKEGRFSAKGMMGVHFLTPDGKAMMLTPGKHGRGIQTTISSEPEDIASAKAFHGARSRRGGGAGGTAQDDSRDRINAARIALQGTDPVRDAQIVDSDKMSERAKAAARKRMELRAWLHQMTQGGQNGKSTQPIGPAGRFAEGGTRGGGSVQGGTGQMPADLRAAGLPEERYRAARAKGYSDDEIRAALKER